MQKLKQFILDILLLSIFRARVCLSPYVQTCLKLQLIIKVGDKFILVNKNSKVKLPSIEVKVAKKHSIIFSVKNFLKNKVSKKINTNSYLQLNFLDFHREIINTKKEKGLFVDNLFLVVELNDKLKQADMLENVVLASLEDIKLAQFKNQFSTLDYKLIIRSLKEKGIDIK